MTSVIERLHEKALMHSGTASRLLRESLGVYKAEAEGRILMAEALSKTMELIEKAAEEAQQASRTLTFIQKYVKSGPDP